MVQQTPRLDPQALLRDFRQSYTNFHQLWTTTGTIPEGVTLSTPQEQPLSERLPAALKEQLESFRKAYPRQKITLLKYMRLVDGRIDTVIEDETALPDDEHLMTFSQTITLNSSEAAMVIADLFVARRES